MKKIYFKTLKRTAIFIDASNVYYSQKSLGWQIDYQKLFNFFKQETNLVKAYFYSGVVSKNKGQQKFFSKMEQFGYIVKTKEVKWIKDKQKKIIKGKGNLDIELALDMVLESNNFDTAILISGDSDFEPIVQHLKGKSKKVIVISSRGHISRELILAANHYLPFQNLKSSIAREKITPTQGRRKSSKKNISKKGKKVKKK